MYRGDWPPLPDKSIEVSRDLEMGGSCIKAGCWALEASRHKLTAESPRPQIRQEERLDFKMSLLKVPLTLRDSFWNDPFFSTNWTDFNKFREEMFKESQEVWKTFNRQIESFQKGESSHSSVAMAPFPSIRNLLRSFSEDSHTGSFKWSDDQVISQKDDTTAFQLSLDTHNYKPDNIKVTVGNDGVLKVEGKYEEKAEDGSRYISRQFTRQYTLPKECRPERVVSNLSSDGVLMITAPKEVKAAIKDDSTRSVPIEMKK